MRRVAFLLLAFIGLYSCKDGGNNDNNTSTTDTSTNTDITAKVSNEYYKRYTGTIADVPVVLNLVKSGSHYSGTYYYEKIGNVLRVFATSVPDSSGQIIFWENALTERDDDDGPHWQVMISDDAITGKWISADKQISYDVSLKEDYTEAMKLGAIYTYDSIKYIDSLAIMATCELQFITPSGDDDQAKHLSKALGNLLVCTINTSADFVQCMEKKKESYFSMYLADMKDFAAQDLLTESYSYNFAWTESQNVYYNKDGWICICFNDWQYTGGAHGNYNSAYSCIDVRTGRIWELKDIVTNTGKLVPLIDKNVRKQFNLTDKQALNSRLFVDEMYATENFFITDKGITFVYTSYEIASYADGEVNVFLPFSSITKWLSSDFKERMNLVDNSKSDNI